MVDVKVAVMITYNKSIPLIFYKGQVQSMSKIIHLQLTGLEITHSNAIQESYFSFTFEQSQYFSSTFDHEFQRISDDIFLTLHDSKIPEFL